MKNTLKLTASLILLLSSYSQALPINLKALENTVAQSEIEMFTVKINQAFSEIMTKSKGINASNCKAEMNFQFLTPSKNSSDTMEDFEKHAIQGRFVDCIDNATPEELIDLMLSEKFIMKTVKGIEEVKIDQAQRVVCMKTSIFPFGKTNFCYNYEIKKTADGYFVRNGLNRNLPDTESPVFAQEGLIIVKAIGPNRVSVAGAGIGRGPKIPFHGIAIKVFASEQQKFFKELRAELNH